MVTAICAFAHARRGFPHFAGSLAHALTTCTLPPLILVAHHNISPSLEKQLVLELERWMSLTERFKWLPGGLRLRHVRPVNEHVPDVATQAGTQNARWLRK